MPTIGRAPLLGSTDFFYTPQPASLKYLLYPVCMGEYFCDNNYYLERSDYDSFLFMYVKSGEGYVKTVEGIHTLRAGDFVFLDCYRPHSYWTDTSMNILWLHFDGALAREYYNAYRQHHKETVHISAAIAKRVLSPFFAMYDSFKNAVITGDSWYNKYITDILTYIVNIEDLKEENSSDSTLCDKALLFIQNHYSEDISVEGIAKYLSVSPSYFMRLYKREMGTTPYANINALRIEQAKYELKTTKRTVSEIGFHCGFNSVNSFCITFKKCVGLTPTEYRN